jgi:hypothetical protein
VCVYIDRAWFFPIGVLHNRRNSSSSSSIGAGFNICPLGCSSSCFGSSTFSRHVYTL